MLTISCTLAVAPIGRDDGHRIYELRYGGKPAAVLREFRALYLGLVFRLLVMGTVCSLPSNWAAFCWAGPAG